MLNQTRKMLHHVDKQISMIKAVMQCNDGTHGWIELNDDKHFITVEQGNDDFDDTPTVILTLTDKLDDLGYPFGACLDCDVIHECEIDDERIIQAFDSLCNGF